MANRVRTRALLQTLRAHGCTFRAGKGSHTVVIYDGRHVGNLQLGEKETGKGTVLSLERAMGVDLDGKNPVRAPVLRADGVAVGQGRHGDVSMARSLAAVPALKLAPVSITKALSAAPVHTAAAAPVAASAPAIPEELQRKAAAFDSLVLLSQLTPRGVTLAFDGAEAVVQFFDVLRGRARVRACTGREPCAAIELAVTRS